MFKFIVSGYYVLHSYCKAVKEGYQTESQGARKRVVDLCPCKKLKSKGARVDSFTDQNPHPRDRFPKIRKGRNSEGPQNMERENLQFAPLREVRVQTL